MSAVFKADRSVEPLSLCSASTFEEALEVALRLAGTYQQPDYDVRVVTSHHSWPPVQTVMRWTLDSLGISAEVV